MATVIEALGDRLKTFSDILTLGRYFFTETLTHDPDAVKKRLRKDGVPAMLERTRRGPRDDRAVRRGDPGERPFTSTPTSHNHPMGQVVNPLRVATTGQGVGPGLYDCLAILGREILPGPDRRDPRHAPGRRIPS